MLQADMQQVDVAVIRREEAYERYGWMILSSSAVLGMISAVITTSPPISWFWNPIFESTYSIMGAWGVTWVGFNIFALVMTLIPYRRYEKWAWYTLWLVPLRWLSQFGVSPNLGYLIFALLTTTGLRLPHRR